MMLSTIIMPIRSVWCKKMIIINFESFFVHIVAMPWLKKCNFVAETDEVQKFRIWFFCNSFLVDVIFRRRKNSFAKLDSKNDTFLTSKVRLYRAASHPHFFQNLSSAVSQLFKLKIPNKMISMKYKHMARAEMQHWYYILYMPLLRL